MAIRAAVDGDETALGELAGGLVRMHHALDPARFMAPPDEVEGGYGAWLAQEARRPGATVLVADLDDEVVGYAYATVEGRDWNELLDAHGKLHDVFVAERARRRGVARALIRAARGALLAAGCERIVLSTATRNDPARRLFASEGFEPSMIEMAWHAPAARPR
jgi:ribosomal protein S18 acetylase RimI-like enzyme